MGQIAQDYVRDILSVNLPNWKIKRNGTIPGISHNAGNTDISFDIVAMSPKKKWYAIEVSFQFTTNSVIERKAGQAEALEPNYYMKLDIRLSMLLMVQVTLRVFQP